jgi:hypothetical protein
MYINNDFLYYLPKKIGIFVINIRKIVKLRIRIIVVPVFIKFY